ncbi:hypothetical protein [uncultured Desulfobacter sp.]|uniref:hypothetical protein n=1 Tax=uncultured Desulfobacter sp. TaxID=240139 RepID=UPI0029F55CCB|nr:hypothetical protein [uncultured Desulfobacter sp.]
MPEMVKKYKSVMLVFLRKTQTITVPGVFSLLMVPAANALIAAQFERLQLPGTTRKPAVST